MPELGSLDSIPAASTRCKPASTALLILGFLTLASGCTYTTDRLRDLTDIVDVKGGARLHPGLGGKIEATDFIWGGLGYSKTGVEFFGRRRLVDSREQSDLIKSFDYPNTATEISLGIAGYEFGGAQCGGAGSLFGINPVAFAHLYRQTLGSHPEPPSLVSNPWRIGGELWLFLVDGGIYLNVGEVVDFLAGLAGLDPAEDDGLPLGTDYYHGREKKKESASSRSDREEPVDSRVPEDDV